MTLTSASLIQNISRKKVDSIRVHEHCNLKPKRSHCKNVENYAAFDYLNKLTVISLYHNSRLCSEMSHLNSDQSVEEAKEMLTLFSMKQVDHSNSNSYDFLENIVRFFGKSLLGKCGNEIKNRQNCIQTTKKRPMLKK